jgi:hypothetical protein
MRSLCNKVVLVTSMKVEDKNLWTTENYRRGCSLVIGDLQLGRHFFILCSNYVHSRYNTDAFLFGIFSRMVFVSKVGTVAKSTDSLGKVLLISKCIQHLPPGWWSPSATPRHAKRKQFPYLRRR